MSNNPIASRRTIAVWICRASAVVMCAISLYMLAIVANLTFGAIADWDMLKHARAAMSYKAGMAFVRFAIFILLAAFFFHFGRAKAPFGIGQTIRLLLAGLLSMFYGIFGEFGARWVNSLPKPMYAIETISTDFTYPGSWLLFVAFGLFLVCLAMVVRYGDALLEDSDNIL